MRCGWWRSTCASIHQVGCDHLDCSEDRLYGGVATPLGTRRRRRISIERRTCCYVGQRTSPRQAGHRVIDPELATEAWTEQDPLTDRERQVLRLAAEGSSSGEIAGTLRLSEGTVRNYLSDAISKLGAGNRVEAARMARMKGWL